MQTLETATPYLNSPDPVPVCATLALIKVRGSFIKVRGASGKGYEFRWSEKQQRMIREYRSPADFTREELDMRKNVKTRFAIVTLLGSTHPVTHAKEAVDALINAGGAVQIPARIQALQDIANRAVKAITAMETSAEIPPEDAVPSPPSVDAPAPPVRVVLNESRWVGDDSQPVIQPVTPEPGVTVPVSTGGLHAQAELMQGEWKSLKELARSLGIVIAQKNRPELVAAILAKENAA